MKISKKLSKKTFKGCPKGEFSREAQEGIPRKATEEKFEESC